MYKLFLKRLLDFCLSLLALILISPVLLAVAVLVRVKLGSPVIFKQKRPGFNEKIFTIYKFRTMTDEKDVNGVLLPDEARLTSFGAWLRSASLDELPEIWNILKGDMSLVGPRPLLIKDMVFMTPRQRQRHAVLPGLTGLAQVNGRNCIAWEDKLAFDTKYADNITLIGDLKILFKTVTLVFSRENVNAEGMATAEDFGDYLLRIGRIDEEIYNACLELTRQINKNNPEKGIEVCNAGRQE